MKGGREGGSVGRRNGQVRGKEEYWEEEEEEEENQEKEGERRRMICAHAK